MKTIEGNTALAFAVSRGSQELIDLLIARGAEVEPAHYTEKSALSIVRSRLNRQDLAGAEKAVQIGCQRCPKVSNELQEELARYYQTQWAAHGNPDDIQSALEHVLKINPNLRDPRPEASLTEGAGEARKAFWDAFQQLVAELYFTHDPNRVMDNESVSANICKILSLSATAPDLRW